MHSVYASAGSLHHHSSVCGCGELTVQGGNRLSAHISGWGPSEIPKFADLGNGPRPDPVQLAILNHPLYSISPPHHHLTSHHCISTSFLPPSGGVRTVLLRSFLTRARDGGFLSMGKDGFARVWYVASMMMLLIGDSCRATKHLSPFGGKAAPSVQHRELQDSCGVCGTEIFLEDDDAEMSCTICNEVLIACMEDYGESETSSGGFGICHPCGDLSVDEVILFYEGLCGDPLSSITRDYISGCLYYLVPPECPSDVTTSDDDSTTESSDDYSTDDDYTIESSDDYSTDDDYTIESSDDYSTDDDYTIESSDDYSTYDDSNASPIPSPSTDDDPVTTPTTTEDNGVRVRACGSVGALAVAVVNVVFLLAEMR